MAMQSCRILAITATIALYFIGMLVLILCNISRPIPKSITVEQFSKSSTLHNSILFNGSGGSGASTYWCTKLKFTNCRLLHFSNGTSTNMANNSSDQCNPEMLTALASFPGSGSTWLRYLIQQATGLKTGSIYMDYGLLISGFPGEGVYNSSVIVVKTHEKFTEGNLKFRKSILLVREPEKAILAEFNRQIGGHVGFASPEYYKNTKYWQQFVANQLKSWEILNLSWTLSYKGKIMVIFYDDLVNDLENILRKILKFLQVKINEALLKCALRRKEGIFRRKKHLLSFDPYTSSMRRVMQNRKEIVFRIIKKIKQT